MTTLYKICKRTIENEPKPLNEAFKADMQAKLDIYSAANKITAEEYAELTNMLRTN